MAGDKNMAGGRRLTHFGPEGNLFRGAGTAVPGYAEDGHGQRGYYAHNEVQAALHHEPPGTFTPCEDLPCDTDL